MIYAANLFALWLLTLRWCSGERSSESAAIPFVGIAQICLTACLHVALGLSAFLRRDSA